MSDVSSRLREFQGVSRCSFLSDDEKWTCAFIGEFFLWSWETQVGRVEPTPCLLPDTLLQVVSFCHIGLSFGRRLFPELVWPLHGFSAFLNEGDGRGRPEGCLGFGAREDVSVVAVVYLEGTFSGGGVYAVL